MVQCFARQDQIESNYQDQNQIYLQSKRGHESVVIIITRAAVDKFKQMRWRDQQGYCRRIQCTLEFKI